MQPLKVSSLRKVDLYKKSQADLYAPDMRNSTIYFAGRGGDLPYMKLFGLQYNMLANLAGEFVTEEDVMLEAERVMRKSNGCIKPQTERWMYIVKEYGGRLPLEIRAVAEGKRIPIGNVMFTVTSTDKNGKCGWLPPWMETVLQQTWGPTAVCSKSSFVGDILRPYFDAKSDNPDAIRTMLHDFGGRACACMEEAALMGAAHLVNFRGSDTDPADDLLEQFYGGTDSWGPPATEHSVMTCRGRDGEPEVLAAILKEFPDGPISIVGDSYNIYRFVEEFICGTFRDQIRARKGGPVIIRPDSGDPVVIVPAINAMLEKCFGSHTNNKGAKLLAPCVLVIWGDGLEIPAIVALEDVLAVENWAPENLPLGMGGGLLRKVNRDTQKVAMKMCSINRGGVEYDVVKDPITDKGKISFAGIPETVEDDGFITTVRREQAIWPRTKLMDPVFRDGEVIKRWTLPQVRANDGWV